MTVTSAAFAGSRMRPGRSGGHGDEDHVRTPPARRLWLAMALFVIAAILG